MAQGGLTLQSLQVTELSPVAVLPDPACKEGVSKGGEGGKVLQPVAVPGSASPQAQQHGQDSDACGCFCSAPVRLF